MPIALQWSTGLATRTSLRGIRRIPVLAALFLAASVVLLRLDPPELVIYPDGRPVLDAPDTLAAQAGCPYLLSTGVPLPVPYTIQAFKSNGEGGAQAPDPSRRVTGLVTACPVNPPGSARVTR
jgi:hypothetical protein